jgi:uncharacterized membrane protein
VSHARPAGGAAPAGSSPAASPPDQAPAPSSAPAPGPIERAWLGLLAHLPAVVGGVALVVALLLLPDLGPGTTPQTGIELGHGRIVELLPVGDDPAAPEARVLLLDGARAGETLDAFLQGPSGQLEVPDYRAGDEVVVSQSLEPDSVYVAVADRWRIPALAIMFGIFAIAVVVVGGWRGLRSLVALVLTLVAVVKVLLPLLLAGWPPVPVAIGSAVLISLATFVLTEGARRTTLAALLGTLASLALVGLLAAAFSALAQFTAIQGTEEIVFLQTLLGEDLDFSGLLLAAVIIGALGVLDDVTISQAATVAELHRTEPGASTATLVGRAMNVGRSHIAATVNTLVLAYVGVSLPLLVLFAVGGQSPALIASQEVVAVEVMRALAGSIGIVMAVPLTTWVAALLVQRGQAGPPAGVAGTRG